ncbi:dihydropteroate synthase [Natrarchaeobaculum aegyptiacum]|uniref:Probable bifunctional folylpolyglutamate synthase/dihydropteroate synthase n=1 Tax=Natrarchaeobaculum aegyptiacum TaxID=745377 RepID=A0A2Z2HVF4_9EURY|nr:dihydropteroate synthase [Natrarchaeobaculum aegyptiacum]ARS91192.1 dihydropteroate synthase [Natrarchaeobaculum aegyptiacum]
MEYHEAINKMERLRRLRPEMETKTTGAMLSSLGNPHEDLPAVQIAGSNGKGSTARLLERILRETGYRVGCYTSPDLNDRRERVRVDGRKIPKREVVRFVETIWPSVVDRTADGEAPTFFEVCTVMALWHFAREDVDVAVLEVGIGGRYDATSVVDPAAAAVTSVSLEHTDILGSTIEEIARDKAQVAPTDAPLVTGASGTALETLEAETDVLTVGDEDDETVDGPPPDVHATENGMVSTTSSALSLVGPDWNVECRTPLLGPHQAINAGIAATLARQIADPGEDEIAAGIRNVHWPGRFEVMDDEPLTVIDGAHNPEACETLATVVERFEYDDLSLVFGALREKDHRGMVRALPDPDRLYLATPDVERGQATDVLGVVAEREIESVDAGEYESVLVALDRALRAADPSDCVLVTGSLAVVAEARDRWTRTLQPVRTPTVERARAALDRADVPSSACRDRVDRLPHRTFRFHVRQKEGRELRTLMESLGGTCAVSGIEASDQHVAVVLGGTLAHFKELTAKLRGRSIGGRQLAQQVTTALGIGADDPPDYQWGDGTAVMGILNVTPDSFHDGGEYEAIEDALVRAEQMVAAGADIVDVGGESTRPGAEPVPADVERERVLPVVEHLDTLEATVSIDTRKPSVAEATLEVGADMVNDVTGLSDEAMRRVVADHGVPAVLMHSLSAPVDPDCRYDYDDVVDDVLADLTERVLLAERAGIDRSNLLVDPGLGFGKTATESFALLDRLEEFRALGTGLVVGHSQKSMVDGVARNDRLAPTVAATALATERGVDVVRVHDVAPNAAAIATAERTTE